MSRVPFIALLLLLGGCATPVGPRSWTGAPIVVGVVHQQGVPLASTNVRLINKFDHDGQPMPNAVIKETTSDANGQFSIGPIGKKTHAAYIGFFGLGESIADWGIQFKQNDQWLTGWKSHKTIGYAPREPVTADCDTSRESSESPIAGAGRGTNGEGFCSLSLKTIQK